MAIPNNDGDGVNLNSALSGLTCSLTDLNFRLDGTAASSNSGSTSVAVNHDRIGDLICKLTSPQGTQVTFLNQPGGAFCTSNKLDQSLLDDESTNSLDGTRTWHGRITAH